MPVSSTAVISAAENIADADLFPKAFASLARHGRLITAGAHGGGTVLLDINHRQGFRYRR